MVCRFRVAVMSGGRWMRQATVDTDVRDASVRGCRVAQAHDPRGRLVRPYAVTGGRTAPTRNIAIEALLQASALGSSEGQRSDRDRRRIVRMCEDRPQSLAELSAYLGLPLGVVRVLVSDMISTGMLVLHDVGESGDPGERIDVLERVLVGLHRL
jgi:hypothetical protein